MCRRKATDDFFSFNPEAQEIHIPELSCSDAGSIIARWVADLKASAKHTKTHLNIGETPMEPNTQRSREHSMSSL